MMKKNIIAVVASLISFAGFATNYTWTGEGTPNADGSLNWRDPANWGVAAGYPGVAANGTASTSDRAVFPSGTDAEIYVAGPDFAIGTIATLGDSSVILKGTPGAAADASTKLTLNGDYSLVGAFNLTLDGIQLFRNANVAWSGALKLQNKAYFRCSTFTLNANSSLSLDTESYAYINGSLAQSGTGTFALSLDNGSHCHIQSASTITGYRLSVAGGSTLYCAGNFEVRTTSATISGDSLLDVVNLTLGQTTYTIELDNSTINCRGHFYTGVLLPGGGTIRFSGKRPLLSVSGNDFRINNNNAGVNTPLVFDFLVPEGGYEAIPVQHLGTAMAVSGQGNPTAGIKMKVNAASPAATAGTKTVQQLAYFPGGVCQYATTRFMNISDTTGGVLAYSTANGTVAPTAEAEARLITATIGSGADAARAEVTNSVISAAMQIPVNRKTLTARPFVTSLSTTAAKTVAVLFVGETSGSLVEVGSVEVTSPGVWPISWTAPEGQFDKTYYLKVELRDLDADDSAFNTGDTGVKSAVTIDTTTYTWTGKGAVDNSGARRWGDPSNWSNDQGGNCLGIPVSPGATVKFPNQTTGKIKLDAPYTIGNLTFNGNNAVEIRFVNGGATTNDNKLTIKSNFTMNGIGGQIVFDGVAVFSQSSFTLGQNQKFLLTNGADFYANGGGFVGADRAEFRVENGSNLYANEVSLQDGNTTDCWFVIDDATVYVRGMFYAPNNNHGANLLIKGKRGAIVFTSAASSFRSNKAGVQLAGVFFEIPAGGYDATPIRCKQNMTSHIFGCNGTTDGACDINFTVLPSSPVFGTDANFTQELISWPGKGISKTALNVSCENASGAISWGDGSNPTTMGVSISASAHGDRLTVSGYPENIPATGVVYGNADSLTDGAIVNLSAPAGTITVSSTKRATAKGWRLYSVNAADGSKTLVSSGAGNSCTYEHAGEWREVEWVWAVEHLVAPSAAANGTVSAPVWCEHGKPCRISATAADGYVFKEWQNFPAGNSGLEFARDADVVCTNSCTPLAVFEPAYAVTPSDNLASALAAASAAGKALVLADGIYQVGSTLTVSTGTRITTASGDPSKVTIIPVVTLDSKNNPVTNTVNTLVRLTHANARISHVTLAGGKPSGTSAGLLMLENATAFDCVLTGLGNSSGTQGGAVSVSSGRLTRSLVANNTSSSAWGGGIVYIQGTALVEYCTITNNIADGYSTATAAGIYSKGGTISHCNISYNASRSGVGHGCNGGGINAAAATRIEYCLVAHNQAGSSGGGIDLGNIVGNIVDHCTIVDNSAMDSEAGVRTTNGGNSVMTDSIVCGNRIEREISRGLEEVSINPAVCVGFNNNALPVLRGVNAVLAVPEFRGDRVIFGMYGAASACDSETAYRLSTFTPDAVKALGYAPIDERELQVSIKSFPSKTVTAGNVTFTARAVGGLGAYVYRWKIDNLKTGVEGEWTVGLATHTADLAKGHYLVTVEAVDGTGAAVTHSREIYSGVSLVEVHPGDDIDEAVNCCVDGGTVSISAGDYPVTETLYVDRGIRIVGVEGTGRTSIYRPGRYNSGKSLLPVFLDNAGVVLDGLCISNSYQKSPNLHIALAVKSCGATITNCLFTRNSSGSGQYGPAVVSNHNGTFVDSRVFDNNTCYILGGGFHQCGPDAYMADVESSGIVIAGYSYGNAAGGCIRGGLAERLYIHDNSNGYGSAGGTGGGLKLATCTLRDSIIANNKAGNGGGGGIVLDDVGVVIENCTIVGNEAGQNNTAGHGGGIDAKSKPFTLLNTVFSGNAVTCATLGVGDPDLYGIPATGVIIKNCAFETSNAAMGDDAVVTENLRLGNDYLPANGSPLIDAGYATGRPVGDVDFDGNARLQGLAIDIGAKEAEYSDSLSCTVDVSGFDTVEASVTVTVNPVGTNLEGLTAKVVAVDQNGNEYLSDWGSGLVRSFTLPAGEYTFTGYVKNGSGSEGDSGAESPVKKVVAKTLYLVVENADAEFPYDTWAKAATNIADIVGYCGNGTTVNIGEGTHIIAEGVVFNGATEVIGAGTDKTVLRRVGDCFARDAVARGPQMVMFAFLNGGRLANVVVENGYGDELSYGSLVSATRATITNCVFRKSLMGYTMGGAVFNQNGYVADCVFTNFMQTAGYGGVYYQYGPDAIGERLLIANNGDNNYYSYGACAIDGGILRDSVIVSNNYGYAANGRRAGGIEFRAGRLESCLVAFNTAGSGGGGIRAYCKSGDSEIVNCTIVSNACVGTDAAEPIAGGLAVYGNSTVKIVNTVIADNKHCGTYPAGRSAPEFDNIGNFGINSGNPSTGVYELTTSIVGGSTTGLFRNWNPEAPAKYDFRPKSMSALVDAGTNWAGAESARDLNGSARLFGRSVDIGCYERLRLSTLIIWK